MGQVVYSFSEESYFHPFSHTFLPMSERVKGGIERGWGFCSSLLGRQRERDTGVLGARFPIRSATSGVCVASERDGLASSCFFFIDALNVCVFVQLLDAFQH